MVKQTKRQTNHEREEEEENHHPSFLIDFSRKTHILPEVMEVRVGNAPTEG